MNNWKFVEEISSSPIPTKDWFVSFRAEFPRQRERIFHIFSSFIDELKLQSDTGRKKFFD